MKVPHVIPYQGSKRKLANKILEHVQHDVEGAVYEPFAGSAALTLAAAANNIGTSYVIGDKFSPLIELWKLIVKTPGYVASNYSEIWEAQLTDPKAHFLKIRNEFNNEQDPVKFLYLVARCVKNSIRFNSYGEFNQSADNRRLGMKPEKVASESRLASSILKNRTTFTSGDFRKILKNLLERINM